MKFVQNPFNMRDLFMDDNVPFQSETLGNEMYVDVFKMPIGIFRITSISSAISAYHLHRDWMGFDQATELALVVSLLNNTARFNHIITKVTADKLATHNDLQKGGHPFYYYMDEAKKVFGNWQGGTDGRYSVTGMSYKDLIEIFSKPQRLKNVVKILMDLILWVDTYVGKSTRDEIPIHVLELQFAKTIEAIKVAVELPGFEFGLFRIQIF